MKFISLATTVSIATGRPPKLSVNNGCLKILKRNK